MHMSISLMAGGEKAVAVAICACEPQAGCQAKPVRIHPIIRQFVDPAVLEKMKLRPVGAAESKTERNIGGIGGKQRCINSGGERSAGRPAVQTPGR